MASTAITQLIMFIAVLSITAGLIMALKSYSDETESAFNTQNERYNNYIMTSISIDVVHFDNETNITHVYARNDGRIQLKPAEIDVYIDGERLDYKNSARSIVSDTDTINAGIWDPGELLHVLAEKNITGTVSHEVTLVTGNSYTDSETYSI